MYYLQDVILWILVKVYEHFRGMTACMAHPDDGGSTFL
jgi:hypothetical protein